MMEYMDTCHTFKFKCYEIPTSPTCEVGLKWKHRRLFTKIHTLINL